MSSEKNALASMLAQYESNNKPKYEKKDAKVYDLKNYFNTFIKEGVKSAQKTIRILPTADGSSPFVEIRAHKFQVDGEWKTFACLKHEKNEPCPFCEAREALLASGLESDKELAKKYNARMMYIVKVVDRDAEGEGVKFWRFNHDYRKEGIYDKIATVLGALKKDITNAETGRDLSLTINRNQNNAPVVSGIASLDPSKLSEDADLAAAWLADTRTWEDVYAVKSYDYLEILVKGGSPVWSKEKKAFVDKASLAATDTSASELESELTIGVENVKANVKAAATPAVTTTATAPATADVEDDLPF
jgi:hypothetical protein